MRYKVQADGFATGDRTLGERPVAERDPPVLLVASPSVIRSKLLDLMAVAAEGALAGSKRVLPPRS